MKLIQEFVDASDQRELKMTRKKGLWYIELWDYEASWKFIELQEEAEDPSEALLRICRVLMER